MGFQKDVNGKGRWQPIQYEGVPEYCQHCKHQGHTHTTCTVKRREEENRQKKIQEETAADKDKISTGKANEQHFQEKNNNKEKQLNNTDEDHENNQKKDEWQIQKKKTKNNNQPHQQGTLHQSKQSRMQQGESSKMPQPTTIDNQQPRNMLPSGNIFNINNDNVQICNVDSGVQSQQPPPHRILVPNPHRPIQQVFKRKGTSKPAEKHTDVECNNAKDPGTDSVLPYPHGSPNSFNVLNNIAVVAEEVYGGEEGGVQETPTNLQEGETRGREHLLVDHRRDSTAPATTFSAAIRSNRKVQQEDVQQVSEDMLQINVTDKEDAKSPKSSEQNQGAVAQLMNNKSTLSLSKKKRDAIKKKFVQDMKSGQPSVNYVFVPEQAGIHVTPLQIQDTSNERYALRKGDISEDLTDEYRVTHSEDEDDPDQREETNQEDQIKTFRTTMEAFLQKEKQ
ncbi:uncharacterized protein LOC129869818 [Solanum dulcamara]|uniref:uncharacterized protein LOC129869818 n=1 Tax=Solanum dulcamara TaxID=45834 RepID=UPI002484E64C|nr:uncharacterized protein LOC129869818 [Solanum dulcamara]